MPAPESLTVAAMLAALILYTLTGGADFGGGVWDLFSFGPRAPAQRAAIARAIGPIWESNHIWLILLVVLMFAGFPPAFAAISTALHWPLNFMLFGIVARGSAFAFRSHDHRVAGQGDPWGAVFAVASLVTPVLLGICLGAVASGRIRYSLATRVVGWEGPGLWVSPFPWAVGLYTLALCAYLAAVYLAAEVEVPSLREDFRRRALVAGVVLGFLAGISLLLARDGAPLLFEGLTGRTWSLPFHLLTGAVAIGALAALARGHLGLARVLAVLQGGLIVLGWGLSQYPYLVEPDLTVASAAAPAAVHRALHMALAMGAIPLLPALVWLFSIFKGAPPGLEPQAP